MTEERKAAAAAYRAQALATVRTLAATPHRTCPTCQGSGTCPQSATSQACPDCHGASHIHA